jgi:branched-chain amino acid transport system permease protein
MVVSLTLNLEAGYTGVPNFGKVMFVAGGAAIAGPVSGRLAAFILGVNVNGDYNAQIAQIITQVNKSLSSNPLLQIELLVLGVGLAACIGALLGFAASFPAIRLREDYLGMLLLAAAQFFQIFLGGYVPIFGGTQGIEVPDVFAWAGTGTGVRDVAILAVFALFALAVYVFSERIARSPLGRTLRAIRDNEVAARSLGKDDVAVRRKVIVIASAISAMAGAFLTFQVASVGPETWTRVAWTFWPWVIVIIGGAANNSGVALGALVFTFFQRFVVQIQPFIQPYIQPYDINFVSYIVFASVLILFLIGRPDGILRERSSLTLPWRTVQEIMNSKVPSTPMENEIADRPETREPDG